MPLTASAFNLLVSLVPITIGAASSIFNLYLEPRKEYRGRVSFRRQLLLESANERLLAMFKYVGQMGSADGIRGDGNENPDLVSDFTKIQLRAFSHLHRLTRNEHWFQRGHQLLFITTALGVILLVLSFFDLEHWSIFDWEWRSVFVSAVATLVLIQIAAISTVYGCSRKLDELEDLD